MSTAPSDTTVVLAFDGYDELQVWYPVLRLREAGSPVVLVGITDAITTSVLGYPLMPEAALADLDPAVASAVIVPGGQSEVAGDPAIAEYLAKVLANGAYVAAIGSGAEVLRAANLPGVPVIDESDADVALVEDGPVLLARDTDSLPAFMQRLLELTSLDQHGAH